MATNMEISKEKADFCDSDNYEKSYYGIAAEPADEMTPLKAAPQLEDGTGVGAVRSAQDDIDFTSGFTEQYRREYGNKKDVLVHNENLYLWYRDPKAVAMVIMLLVTFFAGSILLVMLVFTRNPWKIAVITLSYLLIAFLMIFTQVKTAIVR